MFMLHKKSGMYFIFSCLAAFQACADEAHDLEFNAKKMEADPLIVSVEFMCSKKDFDGLKTTLSGIRKDGIVGRSTEVEIALLKGACGKLAITSLHCRSEKTETGRMNAEKFQRLTYESAELAMQKIDKVAKAPAFIYNYKYGKKFALLGGYLSVDDAFVETFPDWQALRAASAGAWIGTWIQMAEDIKRNPLPKDTVPDYAPIKPIPFIYGQDPKDVDDLDERARYQDHLNKKFEYVQKIGVVHDLEELRRRYAPEVEKAITSLYSKHPYNRKELVDLLKGIQDKEMAKRILDATPNETEKAELKAPETPKSEAPSTDDPKSDAYKSVFDK